jgi:riboflavin transporter FmnP
MHQFLQEVVQNGLFVLEILAIVIFIFGISLLFERYLRKKHPAKEKERILSPRKVAMIGLFSAVSAVLMLWEIPIFFAPGFYKLDFSELPIMIITFAFGPAAGVFTEFCKILINLFINGTDTVFVGELANFIIGCSFLLPASFLYEWHKTKKRAMVSLIAGTLSMTIIGSLFNAFYLLPAFSKLYGIPLDQLIAMGTAVNPGISNIATFVCLAVAPFNLIKGILISVLTLLLYKPLSPIMKHR